MKERELIMFYRVLYYYYYYNVDYQHIFLIFLLLFSLFFQIHNSCEIPRCLRFFPTDCVFKLNKSTFRYLSAGTHGPLNPFSVPLLHCVSRHVTFIKQHYALCTVCYTVSIRTWKLQRLSLRMLAFFSVRRKSARCVSFSCTRYFYLHSEFSNYLWNNLSTNFAICARAIISHWLFFQ